MSMRVRCPDCHGWGSHEPAGPPEAHCTTCAGHGDVEAQLALFDGEPLSAAVRDALSRLTGVGDRGAR